jgi:pimeloyl-ACP methyl ester carboxylesterase
MLRKVRTLSWALLIGLLLAASARAQAHTYVLHLNGIGGERSIDRMLVQGLKQGGVEGDYRIYDWTGDESGMLALSDVKLHQSESAKVAAMLLDYRTGHPNDRIILTSHSAGAGIAAWALARLPADVSIDTWVMLAPALSPKFDLSQALAHVKGKAYAFTSMNDVIVLGAGTTLMGTVDRVKTDAAGRVGFTEPISADAVQYQKLVSVPYDMAWIRFGNVGDHIGPMMRPFARHVIAPTLLDGVVPTFPPLAPTTDPAAVR